MPGSNSEVGMVISVIEAERMSHPEIEIEISQLGKFIDYHIRKYYPGPIPLIKFCCQLAPRKVIKRIRELYMTAGWVISLVDNPKDLNGRKCLHLANPERPY